MDLLSSDSHCYLFCKRRKKMRKNINISEDTHHAVENLSTDRIVKPQNRINGFEQFCCQAVVAVDSPTISADLRWFWISFSRIFASTVISFYCFINFKPICNVFHSDLETANGMACHLLNWNQCSGPSPIRQCSTFSGRVLFHSWTDLFHLRMKQ